MVWPKPFNAFLEPETMPSFDLLHLLTWLHFAALATAIGGAVAVLMISGLETVQPEFQGLAPALWAKQVRWGLRIAVVLGILMLLTIKGGGCPLRAGYLHLKLPLGILALVLSEITPKALAAHKRGAALLALLLMLLAGFVAFNRDAFQRKPRIEAAPALSAK